MRVIPGTCKMGASSDAVVGPDLKVRGLDRLCVIDSLIMSAVTGGNTEVPTLMIAENGFDLVAGRQPVHDCGSADELAGHAVPFQEDTSAADCQLLYVPITRARLNRNAP